MLVQHVFRKTFQGLLHSSYGEQTQVVNIAAKLRVYCIYLLTSCGLVNSALLSYN